MSLTTINKEKITFSWSEMKSDVLTVYEKEEYQVAMHYFRDISKEKEALYIEESQKSAKNSLMISSDSKERAYRLRSNYISTEKSSSSNIFVKDEVLMEENENIFSLTRDFSNLEEGAYLLLSSNSVTPSSNLLEQFENTEGSLLHFNNKVQGFTYKIARFTALDAGISEIRPAVTPLRITAQ